jgi:hypothetical protein
MEKNSKFFAKLLLNIILLVAGLIFINDVSAQTNIPSPKLSFVGTQDVINGENTRTIYWLSVDNRAEFADELFEESPDLPPCGRNTKSSRSWIQVNDSGGGQLYAFCAIKSTSELNKLSFTVRKDDIVPELVYIVITDRKTKKKYSSNLISTKKKDK